MTEHDTPGPTSETLTAMRPPVRPQVPRRMPVYPLDVDCCHV